MITKIVGTLFGLLIGFCYSAAMMAIFQSYLAAYMIIRGISLFYNLGFLNEVFMINLSAMKSDNLVKLNYFFYGYSFVIFVTWIVFLKNFIKRRDSDGQEPGKYLDEEDQ